MAVLKPLKVTDNQVDTLSQVSDTDILEAGVAWERDAPTYAEDMYNAYDVDELPEEEKKNFSLAWDQVAGMYIVMLALTVKTETTVITLAVQEWMPPEFVREAVESVITGNGDAIAALTSQLQEGSISLAEWQTGMMSEIKSIHTAASSVAKGGWQQMSFSDWGYCGNKIKTQYSYLQGFADDIASGKMPLEGNRILQRAQMYANAGTGTYEDARGRFIKASMNGIEEKRVLGVADHCPDCLDEASRGWQPIGTLRAIGDSVCLTNCKCHKEYRNANGDVFR